MLGIIFSGGQGPSADIIKRIIETETNSACTLFIAADSGLTCALEAGIKPDWITGDMDSLKDKKALDEYPKERVIRHNHDKDFTDTELAFLLAAQKGCDEFWIVGGGGGRIDHLFGIRSMFERDKIPSRWLTENEDIRCIQESKSGEQKIKNKLICGLQKGACVSVFPLGCQMWEAKSEGLKWPLDNVKWDRGFFGLSNVALNGEFSITAQKGRFMVILPITTDQGGI